MFFYKYADKVLISKYNYNDLHRISESEAKQSSGLTYFLHKLNPLQSRKRFCISHPSLMDLKEEKINLLLKYNAHYDLPNWILKKIKERNMIGINTEYPNWQNALNYSHPKKWNINIVGLGDVGGTLLTGLRLLGGNYISSIGIYGNNRNTLQRWEYEANQIMDTFNYENYPDVSIIDEKNIFNCDMFIFCASKGVPSVKDKVKDVRMAQFEENSKIIRTYSQKARNKNFKGIFAVVSDPVDLLCKSAFLYSNQDVNENIDFNGLSSDQIRGYGLGVMNARAVYYSKQNPKTIHYANEGRAFGPHGRHLIIADSIQNYNETLSIYLTQKTVNANLDIRETGFKPYIAPALSSGALSIIATISGQWHYSSTYMGGVFMGSNNRLTKSGTEIEMLDLPDLLVNRIKSTYEKLGAVI